MGLTAWFPDQGNVASPLFSDTFQQGALWELSPESGEDGDCELGTRGEVLQRGCSDGDGSCEARAHELEISEGGENLGGVFLRLFKFSDSYKEEGVLKMMT